MGTFDLLHTGHVFYLEKAKAFADALVVGVDSDAKARSRKGQDRPIFNERERVHRIAHLRHVDTVVLKRLGWPRWALIRAVGPDVLVASAGVYGDDDLALLASLCGSLEVLPRHRVAATDVRLRDLAGVDGNVESDPS
jgi:D-beta-D-heptose 7-phosphate kinase/D-beta-D-heptose 1-phosphate adenosyltransferase